jgi:hypothetical protein
MGTALISRIWMTEKIEAARDGARLHRNSGRGPHEKGDATLGPFCVDYKEYTESFGVSRKVWAKCQLDALKMRAQPALRLVLGKTGEQPLRVWVIGDTMFQEMLEAWEEKYGEQ